MKEVVSAYNGVLSAFYPHDHSDNCACRKPRAGMLLNAAKLHRLDLSNSWMIGDSPSDIEAGKMAGCRTAFIAPCRIATNLEADVCEESLKLAVDEILQIERCDRLKCAPQKNLLAKLS